ncbi:PEGA domain-containing protein [Candidatus Kuenenbacteria bacterium]|nr:PEGA domain-containing protein [Candidatus Kuenenbacteria bacterium]
MTLTHRRIIYSFFIVVFLIAVWIIVLRVSGYKYDFTRNSWEKTGMIFLETKPEVVSVYLNDKLVGEKTPLRIKDLLPNKYKLRIEKGGWGKWEKEVQISAGQTDNIQYVRIFREKEIPKMVLKGEILQSVISPNGEKVLILKQGDKKELILSLVDLNDGSEIEIKRMTMSESVKRMEFIDNGARAAVFSQNNVRLISLNNSAVETNLSEILNNKKLNSIKIADGDSENVYYINNEQLWKYNWLLRKEELLLPYTPIDYLPGNGKIYFLSNEFLSSISFKILDIENKKEPENVAFWEKGEYQFLGTGGRFLTVKKDSDLLVVDVLNKKTELVRGGHYAKWGNSQTEMLFGDSYELWIYRPMAEDNKYLILTRAGSNINSSEWYPPESHIFYAESGKIKILENMEKERWAVELGQFDEVKEIFINKKGDKLFFVGSVAQTPGFYQLDIQ